MAETVTTNQFKNGMHIEVDGTIYRIVEFQHVKPGKGGAFVRTKLKAIDVRRRRRQDLSRRREDDPHPYRDDERQLPLQRRQDVVLMDAETFEQIPLPVGMVAEELRFMRENDTVQLLTVDGKPTVPAAAGVGRAGGGRRRSRASRATPSRTSPSRRRWRRAQSSRCRCSSTSGSGSRSTPARRGTSHARDPDRRHHVRLLSQPPLVGTLSTARCWRWPRSSTAPASARSR